MLSIEAAFEPFSSLKRRMGKRRAQDAARALALAGFRAGWKAGSGARIDHAERDYGTIEDPGCICRYHVKCREIKALGK